MNILKAVLCLCCSAGLVEGQGTFVYDQQSATEETVRGSLIEIGPSQPLGQSFTPALNSIGFVRLKLDDAKKGNDLGSTMIVLLRQSTITGPVIASTDPVALIDGFYGPVNFYFSSTVPVAAGTKYCLQPMIQSGDRVGIVAYNYGYVGGSEFYRGIPSGSDLWFREGIIIDVPEPGSNALLLLGAFALLRANRCGRRKGGG